MTCYQQVSFCIFVLALLNMYEGIYGQLCQPGTWSGGSGDAPCFACWANSYSQAGSTSCSCNAGYFQTGSPPNCLQCPTGTYSNSNSSICMECPQYGICENGLLLSLSSQCAANVCSSTSTALTPAQSCPPYSQTYVARATSVLNCSCVPGSFSLNGSAYGCTPCPKGYYSSAPNTFTTCTPCAAGFMAEQNGQSQCVPCSLGYYCQGASSHQSVCALGKYCPNASIQMQCAQGTYCPTGSIVQKICTAGSFCSSPSSQVTCNAGFYCPAGSTAEIACRMCSAYATEQWGCPSNSSSDVTTCMCNSGWYGDGFNCAPCESGKWCAAGQANECPAYTSSPPMSSQQNQCICNAGYYWVGSVNGTSPCALCTAGSYCAGGNTVPSVACPPFSDSAVGSVRLLDCVCSPGYYAVDNDVQRCTLCPPGAFCSSGQISSCPANSSTHGDNSGSFNISSCVCNAGFYGDPATTLCTICPKNSFCEGGLLHTYCTENAVTADVGSINASACFCDRGYMGTNNSRCSVCEAGKWCWTGIANDCPNNTMSARQSTHMENCTCNVGYSGADGGPVCELCIPGKYSAQNGSAMCTSCAAGTYSTALRSSSASTCQNCSIGTYNPLPAGNSSSSCVGCTPGSYSSAEGASVCLRCSSGYYMPLEGSAGCIPCPENTQTVSNSTQNSAGSCLCLPSWNCTYTRQAHTNLQLSVVVSWDNLTTILDAWAQVHAVQYSLSLV